MAKTTLTGSVARTVETAALMADPEGAGGRASRGISSVAQEEEEVKLKALREALVVSAVGGLCAYYGAGDAGKVARAAVEVAEAAIAVLAPPFAKPQQKAT